MKGKVTHCICHMWIYKPLAPDYFLMIHPEEPNDKDYKADICFYMVGQDYESLHLNESSNLLL